MYKTDCINVKNCDYRDTCDIVAEPAPYDCPDYEKPEDTWTVVVDPDGDIVGVFDSTHLDEWLKETVAEKYDGDISEIDDLYCFASEDGVQFIDVKLNESGLYRE